MTLPRSVVFLVDVDNTLLDNDRIQQDIKDHLEQKFGVALRQRYWAILEERFVAPGYRDYLGALQLLYEEHPRKVELLAIVVPISWTIRSPIGCTRTPLRP